MAVLLFSVDIEFKREVIDRIPPALKAFRLSDLSA